MPIDYDNMPLPEDSNGDLQFILELDFARVALYEHYKVREHDPAQLELDFSDRPFLTYEERTGELDTRTYSEADDSQMLFDFDTAPSAVEVTSKPDKIQIKATMETAAEQKEATELSSRQIAIDEMVARAQTGDAKAATDLLATLTPIVTRYVQRQYEVKNLAINAEDVTQDALLAIWQRIPKHDFDKNGTFLSSAYKIAYHKSIDAWRKQRHTIKTGSIEDVFEAHLPILPSAEASAVNKISYEDTVSLVSSLVPDERQRQIVALRTISELSAEETAQTIGSATPVSVRVSQHRTTKKLRDSLADMGVRNEADLSNLYTDSQRSA